MIPTIGIMIGGYIFTRMVQLMTDKTAGTFVKILAILTAITTVLCVLALIGQGAINAARPIP